MAKDDKKQPVPKTNWSLIKTIRSDSLYKNNIKRRDKSSRKYIIEDCKKIKFNKELVIPGQVLLFDYLRPKTEKQLEYYDAMPCTIFFGIRKTEEGPKVLGFNIHYYPPRMRFLLMDKIYELFKGIYRGSWNEPINIPIDEMDYYVLINFLKEAKLDFGVRMYDIELMTNVILVPPRDYTKIVFTEGRFKKSTRIAIMNYWNNWKTPKKLYKIANKNIAKKQKNKNKKQ